jgi:sensor c-di-GMP phosphodiesterase-like protein
MSYHILHQFDEQWLADLKQETDGKKRVGLMDSYGEGSQQVQRTRLAAHESKRWAVVAAGLLLATFALFFSIDASRRAESLQQRLDALEQTAKK